MEHSHEESATSAPCCLTKLPQELLKMILSNLRPPVGSVEHKEYRECTDGLLAAMHSCRTLLHAGRPILYCEPVFFSADTKTPLKASAWSYSIYGPPPLDAISSNSFAQAVSNPNVAALVLDLPRLEFLIRVVSGDDILNKDAQRSSMEEVLAIQSDILAACTQLVSVSVVLHKLEQAEHVGSLLAAMPDLSSLALSVLHADNKDADAELYAACLKRLAPSGQRALAKLFLIAYRGEDDEELVDDDLPDDTPAVTTGSNVAGELPAIVSEVTAALAIDLRRSLVQDAIRSYLPDWPNSNDSIADGLTGVSIKFAWPRAAFTVDRDTMTILAAPYFKGNRLTTVELEYEDEDAYGEIPLMKFYTDPYGRIAYSPSIFGLFAHARKLRLGMSKGVTLQHLELLATASPQLEVFELPGSLWTLTPAELETASPEQLSAYEKQLVKILERFSHLRRSDLGFWPYEEKSDNGHASSGRPALQQWASSRGLELDVRGCRTGSGPRW